MSVVIAIHGMTCGGCVNAVRNALARAGLERTTVELGRVTLEVDGADAAAVARARAAIANAGFEAGEATSQA